jgi:hypothetical protein
MDDAYLGVLKKEKKMIAKEEVNKFRTTARVVGIVYILGFVVGLAGIGLFTSILGAPDHLSTVSANSMLLGFAAVLWLMAVIGDAAHGVLMFPVLKQHSERMAIGYLAFRIVDAIFIAVMVLFVLIQIPLGSEYLKAAASDASFLQALSAVFSQAQQYAYQIGMSALGVSGLMLCYTLYKAKLVPAWLAIWGLVGYATILVGMLSAVMGSGLGDLSSIPGGLWEVFMGVWLIVKGFNAPAIASGSAKTDLSGDKVILSAA